MRSRWSAHQFDGVPLMVDANAAYTLADAAHLAALDRFDLMMIEQPLEYDDIRDHAELQRGCRRRSASTSRSTPSARRKRRSRSAPAASSTSSRAASAGTPNRSGCTTPPRRTAFRSGTAACSRAASAARTTSICRRCRTSRCPATSRPAAATSCRISSSRRSRSTPMAASLCPTGPGIGVTVVWDRVASIDDRHDRSERRSPVRLMNRTSAVRDCRHAGAASCARAPARRRRRQQAPAISVDQKMTWMLQLEDQRILRVPHRRQEPPVAAPVRGRSGRGAAAAAARRPTCSRSSTDPEPRIRRRAALAIGRVGLARRGRAASDGADRHRSGRSPDGGVRARPDRRRGRCPRVDDRAAGCRSRSCAAAPPKRSA